MKHIIILLTASLLACSISSATTATVTAQQGTGVANLGGTALSGTQIDLGHYDDTTNTFTPLVASVATTGSSLPVGLFGGAALIDSSSQGGVQPAIRIVSDGGSSVIAYSTDWTFSSGDGTGLDTKTDFFDLADVVSAGALTGVGVIVPSAGSQFNLSGANNSTLMTPSLAIGQFTAPLTVDSDNADDGVPTGNTTHTFTWTAPASNSTITGYSYALGEVPDDTVDSATETATFTDLAPGNYTFQVKAIAESGISEVETFDLVINAGMVVPTMTEWGIIILVALILLVALRRMQVDAV